jgi:signal peptidase I
VRVLDRSLSRLPRPWRVLVDWAVTLTIAIVRGDIVVFEAPATVEQVCSAGDRTLVKRIVGLPGEVVSMRGGRTFVDGAPLREPYLRAAYRGHESGRWARVPAGSYFVLGDNRALSCDSRRWGVVARRSIIGRAEIRYWPPLRVGSP